MPRINRAVNWGLAQVGDWDTHAHAGNSAYTKAETHNADQKAPAQVTDGMHPLVLPPDAKGH